MATPKVELTPFKKREKWLSTFLKLPHGIFSHDNFGRIFEKIRVRKNSSPKNFATIRHIVLNLLKNNKTFKGSVKQKG